MIEKNFFKMKGQNAEGFYKTTKLHTSNQSTYHPAGSNNWMILRVFLAFWHLGTGRRYPAHCVTFSTPFRSVELCIKCIQVATSGHPSYRVYRPAIFSPEETETHRWPPPG